VKKGLNPVYAHIKNFQSIEDLEIEIRGFTCITGTTNIGKSAIIRGISSAILNNPVGGMVRKGSNYCSVQLSSDGWGFTWEKGEKAVNRVFLPGKDTPLDKIGQKQVSEITEMGFSSVRVGDEELQPWWASQFEPLFLLNQTGPRVTDFISEVSRLTVLQDAIVLSARGKRTSLEQARFKQEDADRLKERLAKVQGLESLEKLGKELEEQVNSIQEYETKITLGEDLLEKIEESNAKIGILEPVGNVKIPENGFEDLIARVISMIQHRTHCEKFALQIIGLKDISKVSVPDAPDQEFERFKKAQKLFRVEAIRKSVDATKGISGVKIPDAKGFQDGMKALQSAQQYHQKISSLKEAVDALGKPIKVPAMAETPDKLKSAIGFQKRIELLQKSVEELEGKMALMDSELTDLNQQIAEIPHCPTCSRPVSANHTGKHQIVA